MAGLVHSYRGGRKREVSGALMDLNTDAARSTELWYLLEGAFPVTISIGGTFTSGTVTILGTTQVARPSAGDNAHAVLGTFTRPGSYGVQGIPYRWVKAMTAGIGGGNVAVALSAMESVGASP